MIGGNLFYFLIRRENGLNDRLKLVKKTEEKKPKLNEIKMKAKKQ